jgi:hypothetical protein
LNWAKKLVTGVESPVLSGLKEKGAAIDEATYSELNKELGLGVATIYDVAQRTPEEIAKYLAALKVAQGVAAATRFARGLYLARQASASGKEAARLTSLAQESADPVLKQGYLAKAEKLTQQGAKAAKTLGQQKTVDVLKKAGLTGKEATVAATAPATTAAVVAGTPAVIRQGLMATIKAHKVKTALGALTAAGAVAGGVAALRNTQAGSALNGTPVDQKPVIPTQISGQGEQTKGKAGRTYEDFIQTALANAGFGTPEQVRAPLYAPFLPLTPQQQAAKAAGLRVQAQLNPTPGSPWSTITGNQAAFNPAMGGREATIQDAQDFLGGTKQEKLAARQRAQDQSAMLRGTPREVMGLATAGYGALQQGSALRQSALTKTAGQQYGRQMAGYQGILRNSEDRLKRYSESLTPETDPRVTAARKQREEALNGIRSLVAPAEVTSPEAEDDSLTG